MHDFFLLSIASVEGKQHLSEIMFSVLVRFSWKFMERFGFRVVPYTQDILDSTNSNPDYMNTILTGDKS
jgi:hypothetical protein